MSKRIGLSLATRIAVLTAIVVGLTALLAGVAIYGDVRQSLNAEIKHHLKTRLAWLQSCVEVDGSRLEFEIKGGRPRYTDSWRVTTKDGRELWSSDWSSVSADFVQEQRNGVEGPEDGTIVSGAAIEVAKGDSAPGSQ